MKIFNEENGVKKVYVQLADLMMLNKIDEASLDLDEYTNINNVDSKKFIAFSDPKEIEFFAKLDWIIDYKQMRNLKTEELQAKIQMLIKKRINETKVLNQVDNLEKEKIRKEISLVNYQMNILAELIMLKRDSNLIPFPNVPDSDSFSFSDDKEYVIKDSICPNKILLSRIDGQKISYDDYIPSGFIESGISIAMMEKSKKDIFFGNYEIDYHLSDDSQNIVIEFKTRSYSESLDDKIVEEKGLKRIFKKLWGKIKK